MFELVYYDVAVQHVEDGKKSAGDHIYIYIYIRGSLNKTFFRMGTFIDSAHMKL